MAKGNESYTNISAVKLRKTNPASFRETRPRESKPRSNFVWVHKAKGNEVKFCLGSEGRGKRGKAKGNKSYNDVGGVRLRETNATSF